MTLLVLRRVSLVLVTTLVACGTAPIDPGSDEPLLPSIA